MSLRLLARLCLLLAPLVAAGCGQDHAHHPGPDDGCEDAGADVYEPGMSLTSPAGHRVILVEAEPDALARYDNRWTVEIRDAADAPRDDATLVATPWMPAHGHGSTKEVVVTPAGSGGRYELDPIYITMPGLWEVEIDVTVGDEAGAVTFAFCVPQ
jgi:hypothetical protein